MNRQYPPNTVPQGVEILWSNTDPEDPGRYINGANFHTAELRLNHGVDISPGRPLEPAHAERIFLMSLGMSQPNQTDYLGISKNNVEGALSAAHKRLGAKSYHAIRRSFRTGIIEVVQPLILPEPPTEKAFDLVNILCNYSTLREAQKNETTYIKTVLGETAAHYGLRGLYDFITWAHAVGILDSSPPTFVPKPDEEESNSDLFTWHQTDDGFIVNVFDEERPCAQLEFEGKYQQTAWLRAIVAEGGRIAVKNFFDTPEGRVNLSQAELGALAITSLGGLIADIKRLNIKSPDAARHGAYEKLGVPKLLSPYGPARATVHSFERGIMTCETPPTLMAMRLEERERLRLLARFDSHRQAAQHLGMPYGSLRTLLSNLTVCSSFPNLPGLHLMSCAADAYARVPGLVPGAHSA